ncbi:MAG: hypothetical protein HON14_02170 [Rhodospirillaceae bacterium]|jgi:hypothetical protein|nr:hypothetical protein [Rhodospirillaceae bacterium]MBT4589642.1 hypothetical protein [Rhodospirillaceae bacterium]MBT4937908.1 hypothetical protein [Rhodospirillaceae bacterium]MBT5939471.1 hypothetical protein [Rhodospirillaceae bacterium]MBT7269179.1 hypothetical protein [Rhodospirillaceae bacterium]
MKLSVSILALLALLLVSPESFANEASKSPYAGQEKRQIKSLSEKDVDDLLNGRGWGLAKAAELNGMPGPAHLIEFADKIGLSDKQRASIQALFLHMQSQAIQFGTALVQQERNLDQMFANKNVTRKSLAKQLEKIASVRSKLRQVHLETHLKTPAILTQHQVVTYNQLRGYSGKSDHSGHH